jgi:hypothetical protein
MATRQLRDTMKMIAVLSLLLISISANAQQDYPRDITLSWTSADSYTDGTLMETGDLTEEHFDCYRQNEATPTFSVTIPAIGEGAVRSETFAGVIPNPGTYRCEGFSLTVDDISDASNSAFKKFTGKPMALKLLKFE